MSQLCALPNCSNEIGSKSFKLGMFPGKYCSTDCVNEAFMLKKEGKPFARPLKDTEVKEKSSTMDLPAENFGNASITRKFCDNAACHRPVTLSWKSPASGKEYCSNECLKTEKPEKDNQKKKMSDENDSPIAPAKANKKATKKATKKAVAKKAVAKKAAKPAEAESTGTSRSKYADDAVITVKNLDHGKKGNRAAVIEAMKSGMTIAKYKAALEKLQLAGMYGWAVNTAVEGGHVTIK